MKTLEKGMEKWKNQMGKPTQYILTIKSPNMMLKWHQMVARAILYYPIRTTIYNTFDF